MRYRTPATPLPDYGFDFLKEVRILHSLCFLRSYLNVPIFGKLKTEAVINILLMSLVLSAAFLVINNNDDFLLLRRLFFMLGITALLRPCIFCMTSLPDPSEHNPVRSYPPNPPLVR